MKIIHLILLAGVILFTLPAWADQKIFLPTKASKPLPTIAETNINTAMTEKVQSVISKNPKLKGQAVSAASDGGHVILQGSVENRDQEKEAIRSAQSVEGVKSVRSQLTIKGFR